MRKTLSKKVEDGRELTGVYRTTREDGCNGRFRLHDAKGNLFLILASDGYGWEHVSVTLSKHARCPSWDEMCWVKHLFWDDDETVIQYHPAADQYVNGHPYCLHLWKPIGIEFPTPHPSMVGTDRMIGRDGLAIKPKGARI